MKKEAKFSVRCEPDVLFPGQGHGVVTLEVTLLHMYKTEDVSVLKDGTVSTKTMKESESYDKPRDGTRCTIRVDAATDGKEPLPGFTGPKQLKFVVGNGQVCDALDCSANSIAVGERVMIICTKAWKCQEPQLGLQDVSAERVELLVEMLEIDKEKELWSLSLEDKVRCALQRKEKGADLFKAKKFEMALSKYNTISEYINDSDFEKNRDNKKYIKEFTRTINLNKAACYLQIGDPTNALVFCNKVIEEDRNNPKALFRRAKAHHCRSEHVEAATDLNRVLELEPENKEAKTMLQQVLRAQKVLDKQSRSTFAKMCGGLGRLDTVKANRPTAAETVPVGEEEEKTPRDMVKVAFKIDRKLGQDEKMVVLGESETLGEWDPEKGLVMTKEVAPPDWEAMRQGKPQPECNVWSVVKYLPEADGRVEYRYAVRGPSGHSIEEGSAHAVQLSGMGGSRCRCTDEWRGAGQ